MGVYLELSVTAKQGNSKIINGTRIMRVEVPVARLHDVVVREPLDRWVGVLVDGRGVQGDGLIACDVAPALALAGDQFWVEAPGDDGVDDCVVCTVQVVFFGNGEELALAVAGAGSVGLG